MYIQKKIGLLTLKYIEMNKIKLNKEKKEKNFQE